MEKRHMSPERKEYLRNYRREWMRKRRQTFLQDKKCVKCGSKERLEIDHIDPSTKITHRIWSWSEVRRNEELAKCQVLCEECHKRKTHPGYCGVKHGTLTGYSHYKCRCRDCVSVKSLANRDFYWSSARAKRMAKRKEAKEEKIA